MVIMSPEDMHGRRRRFRGRFCLLVALITACIGAATLPQIAGGATTSTKDVAATAVLKSIANASKITSIPSSLSPPLTDFGNETAGALSGDNLVWACDPYRTATLATKPVPCFFGDLSSTKTIAIVGDSNVGNWVPALNVGLKAAGYRLAAFSYAGCPTADVTYRSLPDLQTSECNLWHKTVPPVVKALHPIAVLLASGENFPSGMTNSSWISGFAKLFNLTTFPSTVRILMGTSPFTTVAPPNCLAAHSDPQACELHYATGSQYPVFLTRDPFIAQASHATLIPTYPWLCVKEVCPPIVSHYLTLADTDHLTTAYSQYIAPVVTAAVLNVITNVKK
jgi:hypothetical protein